MVFTAKNISTLGETNNYLIGGTLCNAFVLGNIGSADDFFLVGVEPPEKDSVYPLLTGNFLDSEGQFLFRLVRNELTINPGNCSKISADHTGYEIHDSAGQLVFKVNTEHVDVEGVPDGPVFLTTITGNFFDKEAALAFGAQDGQGTVNTKSAFGYDSGGFSIVFGMTEYDKLAGSVAMQTSGGFYELVTGTVTSEVDFVLDGKILVDAEITNSTVRISTGDFKLVPPVSINNNRFTFDGTAGKVYEFLELAGCLREQENHAEQEQN